MCLVEFWRRKKKRVLRGVAWLFVYGSLDVHGCIHIDSGCCCRESRHAVSMFNAFTISLFKLIVNGSQFSKPTTSQCLWIFEIMDLHQRFVVRDYFELSAMKVVLKVSCILGYGWKFSLCCRVTVLGSAQKIGRIANDSFNASLSLDKDGADGKLSSVSIQDEWFFYRGEGQNRWQKEATSQGFKGLTDLWVPVDFYRFLC